MGDFDFGQFQQIMDYLSQKLSEGGALTPEEQQIYNQLTSLAGQGLNLTNTADFNSLYNAFNGLADQATKDQFEQLYGQGLVQNPDGTISYTRPGTLMEALQRRGQSINDGPAQATLSEGLKKYLQQIAQNKFAGMTNAYAAMTPIRAQNIQAYTNAGNIASTAIGRRVPVIGAAISGARGGAGEGSGEGINIDTRGGPGSDKPGFLDKYGGALLGLLGTAGLGVGGYLLKKWWEQPDKTPEGDVLERTPPADINPYTGTKYEYPNEMTGTQSPEGAQFDMPGYSQYSNMGLNMAYPTLNNPYMSNNPVDQYWNQPQQQYPSSYPTNYDFNTYNVPQQTPTWDQWTGGQDQGWYQPEQSVYPDQWSYSGGGGDVQNYSAPDTGSWQNYYDYGSSPETYYPSSNNWYDENY